MIGLIDHQINLQDLTSDVRQSDRRSSAPHNLASLALPPAACLPRAASCTSKQMAIDDILRFACDVKIFARCPFWAYPIWGGADAV